MQIHPSLPTTDGVTEEDSTKKTLKWVNNTGDRVTRNNAKVTISMNPPNYEQSEKSRKNIVHDGHPNGADRQPTQDAYQAAPPTANRHQTEPVAVATGHFQAQTTERTTAPSKEETEEDKTERKRQQLERRKVPARTLNSRTLELR